MSIINFKCPFHSFSLGVLAAIAAHYVMTWSSSKVKDTSSPRDDEVLPDSISSSPYHDEIMAAVKVALRAGKAISNAIDLKDKGVSNKGDGVIDFVTETDKANERLIFAELQRQFPTHALIGEEDSTDNGITLPSIKNPDIVTFIVDPIDGTTNFCHAFPFSCVSIGIHHKGAAVAGVVYDPALNELFVAASGCGAFCNGKKISTSNSKTIASSMFLTEIGYQRDESRVSQILEVVRRILRKGPHSFRIMGSGVLDLCYVASGRLDFIYSGVSGEGWKPWDHCAGSVIVTEAGGVLSNIKGERFDVFGDSVIAAANATLLQEVIQVINEKAK